MDADPFSLLGLVPRFDLHPAEIDRAYLARIASAHPDRARSLPDDPASAALNAARATLLDPEARARLLLTLLEGGEKQEDRSLPPEFLESVMEVRQQIERDAGDEARIGGWREWADQQRDDYIRRISELFVAAAGAEDRSAVLSRIRRELNAWRYIERLLEQI